MVRESCGCDAETRPAANGDTDAAADATPELARDRFHAVLNRELRTGDAEVDRERAEAIESTVGAAVRLLDRGDEATPEEVRSLTTSLRGLTSNPETLRHFTDAMTDHAQRIAASRGSTTGASPVSARVAAALWREQAGAFLHQAETTDAAVAEQYVVDAGLLETGGADPRDLHWLAGTRVAAGALALWKDGRPSGLLKVVGSYDAGVAEPVLVGSVFASEDFPPEALVERAAAATGEVCVVVPVSTREHDWGLLAVVAEIDPTTAREAYQHWAALLCAALESQRRQEEIRKSALFDGLTGLPNRHLFVQQLEKSLARWKRSRTPFSVLFLDLDGFKLINDSLGHEMGDRVLKAVGAEILRELRSVDTAARFGGDEFVILLSDTDASRAMVAAKRVQAKLDKVRDFDGHEIITRASIGIASSAVEYSSTEEILRDADAAMYRAKMSEPGSVAYFDAPMHESAERRAALAKDVLRALQEDQFEVYYQPIVNLASGVTDRFEALVRWHHPERGLIEPTEFLVDIEETSLIIQLGHQVLDDVCRQLAAWRPRVANIAVNISDKEFWSQDLQSHVLGALEQYDLDPDLLTLEITETRADAPPRDGAAHHAQAARRGSPAPHRRLRHRVLLARDAAPVPRRGVQDRPVVHPDPHRHRGQHRVDLLAGEAGQGARALRGRGGRRDRGAARPPEEARLRDGPGVPVHERRRRRQGRRPPGPLPTLRRRRRRRLSGFRMAKTRNPLLDLDPAADAAGTYVELLEDGVSDEQAVATTLERLDDVLADVDDGPVAIVGLAIAMAERGRLTDAIRDRALAALDSMGPRLTEDATLARGVERARTLLSGPPRSRKRIVRRWRPDTTLVPGDVLAYRHGEVVTLLRVARINETRYGRGPILVTLDWEREGVPELRTLKRLRDLPLNMRQFRTATGRRRRVLAGELVDRGRPSHPDYGDAGFVLVGNIGTRRGDDAIEWTGACRWDFAARSIEVGGWFKPSISYGGPPR